MQMLWDILRIVILPVLGGVLINTLFSSFLHRIKTVLPAVSVAAIVIIIGIVIALNHERIGDIGGRLLLAVALHNALGLLLGYAIPRLLGRDMKTARTLAIETGMQNSGLAVALAIKYFTPLSALPGALFSLWHNLTGSLLASYWGRRTRD